MVDLVGRKADGWLPSLFLLEPEQAYRSFERIREAASRAARDPDALTYSLSLSMLMKERAPPAPRPRARSPEAPSGSRASWASWSPRGSRSST